MTLEDSIDLTAQSLAAYGRDYQHWAIAFSGGKDSSTVVTLVAHLIESGRVAAPESLTVLYADTRLELTPLQLCAQGIMEHLRARGMKALTVLPEMNDRFFVYMLGRGVQPTTPRCLSPATIRSTIISIGGAAADAHPLAGKAELESDA